MRSAPGSVKTDTLNPQQGGQKMHTKSKLFLFVFFAGLIFMATFCGTAGASEFLADVVMKGGMMAGDGKLWVKGKGFRPENFVRTQPGHMEAQIKRLGTETVMGYKCDKYLFTFKNKKMGTMTQWFSIKLGYPIKIVNKSDMMGEVITELQNIQKTSVKDNLFIVPSGYQEMPSPQMPQMPSKKQ